MADVEEGGKFVIYTQFLLTDDEAPFRVVLDPPIGNLNQQITSKLNFIIGKYFKLLPGLVIDYSNEQTMIR